MVRMRMRRKRKQRRFVWRSEHQEGAKEVMMNLMKK